MRLGAIELPPEKLQTRMTQRRQTPSMLSHSLHSLLNVQPRHEVSALFCASLYNQKIIRHEFPQKVPPPG